MTAALATLITGAIAAPVSQTSSLGAIVRRPVEFRSAGTRIVGTLFLPANTPSRVPGVVVTGAWMTVKEQMAYRYANELAKRGFAALAFDYRGWGESGGKRRQVETPKEKIEDTKAAFRFLRTQPGVDPNRIGGLGICASSGYMSTAVAETPWVRSLALVAPWLQDRQRVLEVYGGEAGVARLIEVGRKAEADYARTGTQSFVPAASLTDSRAIMFKAPYYTEQDRGMLPQWRNEADPSFWERWLTFDTVMEVAPKLERPLVLVHSEAAAIPGGAHRFFGLYKGPKRELWLTNVGQMDFYDRDVPVATAADAVADHFRATLVTAEERKAMEEVRAMVETLAQAADGREWGALGAIFAEEVDVDYTSVAGGQPAKVKASDLIAGWTQGLGRYERTKHNFSDIRVRIDGDSAVARFTGQATHVKANGERWSCGGDYVYRFARTPSGWRATAAKFDLKWEQGTR